MIEKTRVIWSGAAGSVALSRAGLAFAPEVDVIETSDHLGNPEKLYRLMLRGDVPPASASHRYDFTIDVPSADEYPGEE